MWAAHSNNKRNHKLCALSMVRILHNTHIFNQRTHFALQQKQSLTWTSYLIRFAPCLSSSNAMYWQLNTPFSRGTPNLCCNISRPEDSAPTTDVTLSLPPPSPTHPGQWWRRTRPGCSSRPPCGRAPCLWMTAPRPPSLWPAAPEYRQHEDIGWHKHTTTVS